ncbi:MAG: type VI secretion system baseplate subunit TssF [Bryobacteraceae bacterium]|nr:type VI secretion system baseplate subunit TssF [Bryobacteraceae bacterium]
MRDEFLEYYEDELGFLRQMGQEFAQAHPSIARRLLLEADECKDPHVERIIESFAFLTARVRLKIDDEFPEIIEALLTILYPHYVRPLPSMSVVQMHLDPERGKLTTGLKVPRGTMMSSAPVNGQQCKFQTCYDTVLWPVSISEATYQPPDRLSPPVKSTEAVGAIRLMLECAPDITLDKLEMDSLRFFLHSHDRQLVYTIYELLFNNCVQILVRDPANPRRRPVVLDSSALRPVGFREDEGMTPYPRRSFLAYRILQEYFAFPDKYLFGELTGLSAAWAAGFKGKAELIFLISPFEREDRRESLEVHLKASTFRLGCTPIVNLFPQTCDPILLDQRKFEYPVIPDIRRKATTEIYSLDEVWCLDPVANTTTKFEPFYAYRHAVTRDNKQQFWMANRRAAGRKDEGADLYVSLVDLAMRHVHPDSDALHIRAQCTNRDLPAQLPFGQEAGDFHIEASSALKSIVCLRKPTLPQRPPAGQAMFWRLLSHLSLNYLSIVEEGREALQEILRLYNFAESPQLTNQIQGITGLSSSRQFARVISENGISFTRGVRTEIEFDEEKFSGAGVFLFAQVLEHFLGLYVTINSYSQLVARTRQRKGVLREWQPRAGQRILL